MRRLGQFFVALALAWVCSPTQAGVLSTNELNQARKLYVAKCAKCHKLYEPTNYTAGDWSVWMEKMNRKSKLNPERVRLLARYLDAYRAGEVEIPKR